MLRDDGQGHGQYSLDGGLTWQNFSGASSLITFGDATTTYTFENNYSSIMVVVSTASSNPQSTSAMHFITPNVTSSDITLTSTSIKAGWVATIGAYVYNAVTLYQGSNVNVGDVLNLAYASTGNPASKSYAYVIIGG